MSILPAQPMGTFLHEFSSDTWSWSGDMFRLHGYEPDAVEPTADLILHHKHDDDRGHVSDLIGGWPVEAAAFSNLHRIVDTRGRSRRVLSVGDVVAGPVGRTPVAMRGFTIDLTERLRRDESMAVRASAAHRAAIEQAKGVLMATYGLDADAAMAFLKRWSMDHNVRVADAAEAIVESFRVGSQHPGVQAVLEALVA